MEARLTLGMGRLGPEGVPGESRSGPGGIWGVLEGPGGGARGMPVFGLVIMSGGRSGVEGTLGVSA